MDIRKLQRAIVDGLEDVKAQDIQVFNTEHLSPLFERVIMASGLSNRQTKALAASVRDAVKSKGFPVMRTEGEDNGEWIIVDCGAAVAHIMQPEIRRYYHLEEIWGGKAVKMKFGAVQRGLVKASEDDGDDDDAPAAPAGKRRAAPAAAKTARPAGAKSAAHKPTASKTAAAKKAPSKPRAAPRTTAAAPARSAAKSVGKAPGKTVARPSAPKPATARTSSTSGRAAPRPAAGSAKAAPRGTAARKTPARKTVPRA